MKPNYNKLWKILIDKGINKTQLCENANISTNAMAKLGKNEPVHMDVLVKICDFLKCNIEDIVEVLNVEGDKDEKTI